MKISIIKRIALEIFIFWCISIGFFFLADEHLQFEEFKFEQPEITGSVGELTTNTFVEQQLFFNYDSLSAIKVQFANYGHELTGEVLISLSNLTDQIVYPTVTIPASNIYEGDWFSIELPFEMHNLSGKKGVIHFSATSPTGKAPTVFYSENAEGTLNVNGKEIPGQLALTLIEQKPHLLGKYYWHIITLCSGILFCILIHIEYCRIKQLKNVFLVLENVWIRYRFLIKQLVSRDFKTKYKRSVLGYLWSFLNPLLTSLVQYMVFSTLFKSDIDNFPIYLLTGTLFFGFFSEAINQGLSAIVSNAALITKVYVPKWIYPVTKVCASATNFIISLAPLLVVALFTGCKLTPAILLIVFDVCCLLIFCIGLSMALSACNVFFRDTQYLWSIVSMIWMYSTPLFYPESILPEGFRKILQFNPLYHYIKFARICVIDGTSPELSTYAFCIIAALCSLTIGCIIFKKTQDRFALYI